MIHDNKAIILRWFEEVWNQGNEAAIDELLAPHAVAHGLDHAESVGKTGPEAFKPFYRMFRGAFPDIYIHVDDIIEEGDWLAVRFTVSGTHTGDGLGVAATGRSMKSVGILMAHLQGGQFIEGYNVIDLLSLFRQIGALPRG